MTSPANPERHYVNGHPLQPPYPDNMVLALFGMGCFWGAEKRYWETRGVYSTSVGYAGGRTPNPSYNAVCTGTSGHSEVVRVVYDPQLIHYEVLLQIFWESHNPTQGMRQGNDIGSQYRSGIYYYDESQRRLAEQSREHYQTALTQTGHKTITTEIRAAPTFYYAELYHQQYLAKNSGGYCGLGGVGVAYPNHATSNS